MTAIDPVGVQTQNQRIVFDLIRLKGPISRADVVRLSKLAFPTVSRIVADFLEQGLVLEAQQRRGGLGKPPTELEVNPRGAYAIGLNLDRDHLSGVLMDLAGKVHGRVHYSLGVPDPQMVLPLMHKAANRLFAYQGVSKHLLLGAGVGLPAPLHTAELRSALPADLTAWAGVSLPSVLGRELGCPVLLENNATAAAIGERWYGVGREIENFLFVFFAHGVGGGVVQGGQPQGGFGGFAGELGNIPVRSAQPGAPTTVGEYLALGVLHRRLQERGHGTHAEDLERLFLEGDKQVLGWLEAAATHLAPVLVYAEYLLDPEAIIFGGRLPERLTDALIERLGNLMPPLRNAAKPYLPKLLRGETGEDAAALGAATLPMYQAMTPASLLEPNPTPVASRATSGRASRVETHETLG